MDDDEVQTPEQIIASLHEYKVQREGVRELLAAEPDNEEYLEMARGLDEVIELTEDLLNAAQASAEPATASAAAPESSAQGAGSSGRAGFSEGTKVKALYSGDGEWYFGTVSAVSPTHATVLFDEYGNSEDVEFANIKIVVTDEEAYVGAAAMPKRVVAVEEAVLPKEIPKSLTITEADDEETKEKKKKKIKQYKQRVRQQEQHAEHNHKQNDWQSFQKGKGMKRKAGFFTSGKRTSIFASSEAGKVGVVGSGKGMTDFSARKRVSREGDDE